MALEITKADTYAWVFLSHYAPLDERYLVGRRDHCFHLKIKGRAFLPDFADSEILSRVCHDIRFYVIDGALDVIVSDARMIEDKEPIHKLYRMPLKDARIFWEGLVNEGYYLADP
jgi:hypothetical protein